MENKKNEECIFCFSLLFSTIKIEYRDNPIISSNCYLNHEKQIPFSLFGELNNKSYDNIKLKVECPLCKEYLDKDNFFICIENNRLICPKCIALNIIISSSSNKKKKGKTKKTNKIKNEPHYETLISLLKESIPEKSDLNLFDEKLIEKENNDIMNKFKEYKDIIIREKYIKELYKLFNFLLDLNKLKKKIYIVYRENKGYLSQRFHENVKTLLFYDGLIGIFQNNFSFNEINKDMFISNKELSNSLLMLHENYKSKIDKSIFVNKLLLNKEKNKLSCIYQQESIISYILNFMYENENNPKDKENFLIISSNNGIINVLNLENYKQIYILDIFQAKGVYHLIQSKKEKNIFYASSWGCFKKIKISNLYSIFLFNYLNLNID